MQFTPKTEEEVTGDSADFQPFPKGAYDFQVESAAEKTSKSGNPMIELVLTVWVGGVERKVWDYLVGTESSQWKLRHFCYATGLHDRYESGELGAADCVDVSGRADFTVKPATASYPAKNSVKDYVVSDNATRAAAVAAPQIPDEDIPF